MAPPRRYVGAPNWQNNGTRFTSGAVSRGEQGGRLPRAPLPGGRHIRETTVTVHSFMTRWRVLLCSEAREGEIAYHAIEEVHRRRTASLLF